MDFGGAAKITGIATQGAGDDGNWYTTEYTLSYSLDNGHYEPYKKVGKVWHQANQVMAIVMVE